MTMLVKRKPLESTNNNDEPRILGCSNVDSYVSRLVDTISKVVVRRIVHFMTDIDDIEASGSFVVVTEKSWYQVGAIVAIVSVLVKCQD